MSTGVDRPLGVAILAVLSIIAGILNAILGILAAVTGAWLSVFLGTLTDLAAMGLGALGGMVVALGIIFIILGLVSIAVGWGLWGGRDWARGVAIVLSVLGAIFGVMIALVSIGFGGVYGIIVIAINVIIAYYLSRPDVAAFFGRRVERVPPAAAPPI